MTGAPWAHELGTLVAENRPEHPFFDGPPWQDAVRAAGRWTEPREIRVTSMRGVDPAGILDYVASMSWVAALARARARAGDVEGRRADRGGGDPARATGPCGDRARRTARLRASRSRSRPASTPRGYPCRVASAAKTNAPSRILLAAPRGYCAGVDRAVQTVEKALDMHGPPVYVRKEIVHNKHVVEQLAERGAIFVEEETEVPEGELVVFSAHGVAPAVHANAAARSLRTIDATCPLVTKVHVEARKFAEHGYTIILIGHEGHEEVEGTTGEAPENIILVETIADVDALELADPEHVAFITQTTLSVDETAGIIARLRERFPNDHLAEVRRHLLRDHEPPDRGQAARPRVRAGARHRLDQLVELQPPGRGRPRARRRLAPDRQRVPGRRGLARRRRDGRGSRPARARPRSWSSALVEFFRERGASDVSELRAVDEDVRFMLPKKIRTELAARA